MPAMPHSTVSQNGIRSRLPGATSLPRMPMTTPPMSSQMIPPRVQVCPHLTSIGPRLVMGVVTVTRSTSRSGRSYALCSPRTPASNGGSAPEADLTDGAAADLDVGDVARGHQDAATATVGERQRAVVRQGRVEGLLDLFGRVAGVDDQLARCVLHSDLDFHASPSSGVPVD